MLPQLSEQDIEKNILVPAIFPAGNWPEVDLIGVKTSKNGQKRAKNMKYTDILIKLITVPPSY